MPSFLKRFLLGTALVILLNGCAAPRAPAIGLLYMDTAAGEAATSNSSGNRVGEACAQSLLGLIAVGDASIEAARRAGGITMISSVDETINSVFVFYTRYCTIVRGR